MKTAGFIAVAMVLASIPFAAAGSSIGTPDVGVIAPGTDLEKDYIVGFYDSVPRDVHPGAMYFGGEVTEINTILAFAIVQTTNAVYFEAAVNTDDRVRYIEWNNPAYATVDYVPNDPGYSNAGHYGSKIIGGEAAWDRTLGSTAVKIGVIDSGLRKTHEDFAGSGRVLQGYDFHNSDSDPNDDCGHGTHVAGTIGATINNGKGIAGMAQATLIPIKGLGNSWLGCSGSTAGLANSLQYASDQGAHISSNSWGGGSSTTLTNAITYAYNGGVTQIAAAGNDGPCTNCVGEPWKGSASKVIIVASTTSSDTQSSFSSEGNEIDVSAPGSSIYSSYNSNDASYATLSGTSMAAPHVSGVAALLKTLETGWGYADIDSRLKNTAVDLGPAGFDVDFGFGRINADAATAGLGGGPTYQCSDGIDNDGDGLTDYPADPGCSSSTDNDEYNAPTPQCSDGIDNDGDGLTDYPADPGCSSSSDDDEYNAPTGGTVFSENFDDGVADGWTTNSGTTLWHMNTGCGTAQSGTYKLVWADSTSCTYDVGDTGIDWAQTPAISLAGYTSASASFWHWFNTESYSGGAYDILRVQASSDGTSWTTLQQWDSTDPNVSSWTEMTYDVSGYTGGNLYLRFWADSIDGSFNNYSGWRVDTVSVDAS